MANHPESLGRMMAAWNEPDRDLMREHLDAALAPEVRFADPSVDLTGIDAFEANVLEVQSKNPNHVYSCESKVDSQHGFHRYHWAIRNPVGELVLPGFDVVQTNADGRVVCVIGFFGDLPAQPR
ncbi:MAG: hypothetical protein AAF270_02815 [Pseudomonadota bacterium]